MKRFPPAPAGFVACRVMLRNATLTHLVALDEHGSNGGRPTVCGLTRFDERDESGRAIPNTADLPGWGMGDSGVTGPTVEQFKCDDCYTKASRKPIGSRCTCGVAWGEAEGPCVCEPSDSGEMS